MIAVQASDTDILILLLYHVTEAQVQHKIYMDTGVVSKNTQRYINVSHMVDKIDKPVITTRPTCTDRVRLYLSKQRKGQTTNFDDGQQVLLVGSLGGSTRTPVTSC